MNAAGRILQTTQNAKHLKARDPFMKANCKHLVWWMYLTHGSFWLYSALNEGNVTGAFCEPVKLKSYNIFLRHC
jgi:hypothetical protein